MTMRHYLTTTMVALMLSTTGCKTFLTDASMCDAIKDGSFAVATFGCMKISDMPARDVCTKAGLAGALLAKQACLTKLAQKGTTGPEIGDPADPKDAELMRDASAIIDEWRALESPSSATLGVAPTRSSQ